MHQDAAKFFDEHDESGKADREPDLAGHQARAAEADRWEPSRRAAASHKHPAAHERPPASAVASLTGDHSRRRRLVRCLSSLTITCAAWACPRTTKRSP